jgi:hypothetical protein
VIFAFFVGTNGKPQILVELSRASSLTWDTGKGFVPTVVIRGCAQIF